jgi:hypothetical protein
LEQAVLGRILQIKYPEQTLFLALLLPRVVVAVVGM